MKNEIVRVLCVLGFVCQVACGYPTAKITVKVVDDSGHPVEGATVGVGFSQGGNGMTGKYKSKQFTGISDSNGVYQAKAPTEGHVGFSANKEGFYKSWKRIYFGKYGRPSELRWQGWGATNTLILREIKNPIPMYVKRVDWIELPKLEEPIGFDFEKADWVAPYGKGKRADMFFLGTRVMENRYEFNCTLDLSFPNKYDGLLAIEYEVKESSFTLPYEAPNTTKYSEQKMFKAFDNDKGLEEIPAQRNVLGYFFRIRSEVDDKGELKSALYGKIVGALEFDPREVDTMHFHFIYYLNPTENDRNLEFDPEHNLFDDSFRYDP